MLKLNPLSAESNNNYIFFAESELYFMIFFQENHENNPVNPVNPVKKQKGYL